MRDVLRWLHTFISGTNELVSLMRADSRETSSTNNDTGATTSTDTGAMEAKANCDEVLETTTPAVNPKKVKAAVAAIREILGATSTADTDESAAATTGAASAKPRARKPTGKVKAMKRSENTWSVREPRDSDEVTGSTAAPDTDESAAETTSARALVPTVAKSKLLPRLPMPPCSSGGPVVEEGCKDCNKKAEDLGIPKHLWPVEEHDDRVDAILVRCSLDEFRHKFYAEAITYMDLRLLTDQDLIGLGLKLGQRRRLLDYVKHMTLKRKRDDMGGSD